MPDELECHGAGRPSTLTDSSTVFSPYPDPPEPGALFGAGGSGDG